MSAFSNPLPKTIAIGFATADDFRTTALSPAEQALIASAASESYQLGFAAGRAAAKRALAELGTPVTELLRDADDLPAWPKGIIGSISHATNARQAVAVVAHRQTTRLIGVDLEQASREWSPALRERMTHPSEHRWLDEDADTRGILLFSARECLFKALWPILRRPMIPQECRLEWDEALPGFRAFAEQDLGIGITQCPIYVQNNNGLALSILHVSVS